MADWNHKVAAEGRALVPLRLSYDDTDIVRIRTVESHNRAVTSSREERNRFVLPRI